MRNSRNAGAVHVSIPCLAVELTELVAHQGVVMRQLDQMQNNARDQVPVEAIDRISRAKVANREVIV